MVVQIVQRLYTKYVYNVLSLMCKPTIVSK